MQINERHESGIILSFYALYSFLPVFYLVTNLATYMVFLLFLILVKLYYPIQFGRFNDRITKEKHKYML